MSISSVEKIVVLLLVVVFVNGDRIFVALNNNGKDNQPFLFYNKIESDIELNWESFQVANPKMKTLSYNTYVITTNNGNFIYYINSDTIFNVTLIKFDIDSGLESILIHNFGCNTNLYYCDSILNYRIRQSINGSTTLDISSAIKNRNNGIKYLSLDMEKLKTEYNNFNELEWDTSIELSSNFRDNSEFFLYNSISNNTTNIITIGNSVINNYGFNGIENFIIYQNNLVPQKILQFYNPTTKDGSYKPNLLIIDKYCFTIASSFNLSGKWSLYMYDSNKMGNFSILLNDILIEDTYNPEWVVFELKTNFISFESQIKDINRSENVQSIQLRGAAIYVSFYLTNSTSTITSKMRIFKITLNNIIINYTLNSDFELLGIDILKINKIIDIPITRLNPARMVILPTDKSIFPNNETMSSDSKINLITCFELSLYIFVLLIITASFDIL